MSDPSPILQSKWERKESSRHNEPTNNNEILIFKFIKLISTDRIKEQCINIYNSFINNR